MQKILQIIEAALKLLRAIFGAGPKQANTDEKSIGAMETGFKYVKQTPEVVEAQQKLKQISELPPEERAKKDGEVADIQKVFEKQVAAKAPDISTPAKKESLLDKIRAAEQKKKNSK